MAGFGVMRRYLEECGNKSMRPAFGEILISEAFLSDLLGKDKLCWKDRIEAMEILCQDIVVLPVRGQERDGERTHLEDITTWVIQSSYVVMALLDGPWEQLIHQHGWLNVFSYIADEPRKCQQELMENAKNVLRLAAEAVRHGCQGIVLGEDLAFAGGTFLPKRIMESTIFPVLKELVMRLRHLTQVVFLHSDGEVKSIWTELQQCDFTGFHGQIPLQKGKEGFLHWGGLDPYLEEIHTDRDITCGGENLRGYEIIGTSSGLFCGLSPRTVVNAIHAIKGGLRHE